MTFKPNARTSWPHPHSAAAKSAPPALRQLSRRPPRILGEREKGRLIQWKGEKDGENVTRRVAKSGRDAGIWSILISGGEKSQSPKLYTHVSLFSLDRSLFPSL